MKNPKPKWRKVEQVSGWGLKLEHGGLVTQFGMSIVITVSKRTAKSFRDTYYPDAEVVPVQVTYKLKEGK